ncbi:MAG: MBL fold metallo-hydrolase [Hyphomicrobiaceae bacterium]|nr:MBL fold metallo-hydrolase [Hyphomicrobiaceae bacterium]MCC0023104.1 MBL fold metallo-hydrolase [Hyphomicrobiaceae bacterium]
MSDTPPHIADNLAFQRRFDAQTGVPVAVSDGIVRVTAPNASPYTFTGTNTFLIGRDALCVLDPGPDDKAHLKALLSAIGGRPLEAILLTHTHKDHSRLAGKLSRATGGTPIWFGGKHRTSRPLRRFEINPLIASCDWSLKPDRTLADGDAVSIEDIRLEVIATPGHCANHLCYGVQGSPLLFSGDHVMGWNSTLVAVPDGSMADYFASMRKIIDAGYETFLPAHGGPIADGPAFARALLMHREFRNQQILAILESGRKTVGQIVTKLYPRANVAIKRAAAMTVAAHLEYLAGLDRVELEFGPTGWVHAAKLIQPS